MGLTNLPTVDASEPSLSSAALTQRCKTLAVNLGERIGLPTGEILLASELANEIAVVSLGGRASEMIERNRGGRHRVIPLCTISNDVFAWAGYRENWEKRGHELKFRFVEAGFTLHVGRVGEIEKPQIMRSEWVGPRGKSFAEHAGHPHWQLDVLESARAHLWTKPVIFAVTSPPRVDFEASEPSPIDLLRRLTLERMHLASSTTWWRHPPQPIAHVPTNVADLDRWILGCISYLRQEVGRCAIVK